MIIYQATNKTNQKKYIGQTKNGLKTRMQEHKTDIKRCDDIFHRAIKKYGWDNFEWAILKEVETLDEANYWEEKLIKEHNTCCQDKGYWGYNILRGGDNREHSEESKQKISRAQTGKKHSEETRQKMSIVHKGRKHSEESRQNMSIARIGRKHSKETKAKMSIAQKKRYILNN